MSSVLLSLSLSMFAVEDEINLAPPLFGDNNGIKKLITATLHCTSYAYIVEYVFRMSIN